MLHIENQEHYDKVVDFAKSTGRMENLQKQLDYLNTYADHENEGLTRCILSYDFAPYSFSFLMTRKNKDGEYRPWFNGGLIFHGSHDGGGSGSAPTYSVCLSPTDGWSIHT